MTQPDPVQQATGDRLVDKTSERNNGAPLPHFQQQSDYFCGLDTLRFENISDYQPETVTVDLVDATALAVAWATACARDCAADDALPPPHTFETALETAEAEAEAALLKA